MKFKNKLIIGLAVITLLAAGGAAVAWWHSRGLDAPLTVLTLYGSVDVREVHLGFQEIEHILSVHAEEGQQVSAGQVLATQDTVLLQSQADAAAAQVQARRAVLTRLESGSRTEEVRKARADVEAAKVNLRDTETTARRIEKLVQTGSMDRQRADDTRAAADSARARLEALQAALDLIVAGPRIEDINEARALLAQSQAELSLVRERIDDMRMRSPHNGIIRERVLEPGVSVLVSTAYLDETERCGTVYVLDRGRMLDSAAPTAFTQRMAGRVYSAKPARQTLRVAAARAATASADVVDALPERGRVRIVSRTADEPRDLDRTEAGGPYVITPIAPRFEDYFVDALARVGAAATKTGPPPPPKVVTVSGDNLVVVDQVWRRFGEFAAVKGVSFTVKQGEVFGLLGANGAGKSTLFRMLCGLLPASSGRLRVGGVDMRRAPAVARARLGYVAQSFSLYGNLTVAQNLRFFAAAYGLSGKRRDERVHRIMADFELDDRAGVQSDELPLGYRQRLALAGALMHEPEILFLDEATSGVDPLARREFWRRINTLASTGVTVLVTTHFMEEAEYCDRLVIMQAGEILAEGSPDDIRARSRTASMPEPTMEDAFCALLDSTRGAAAA